ncbi:Hypothetical protein POVN_LOCUS580 [uncultured virus]|nr:Hypothetical protein POVN_LOCUS580 [uncultured virus]
MTETKHVVDHLVEFTSRLQALMKEDNPEEAKQLHQWVTGDGLGSLKRALSTFLLSKSVDELKLEVDPEPTKLKLIVLAQNTDRMQDTRRFILDVLPGTTFGAIRGALAAILLTSRAHVEFEDFTLRKPPTQHVKQADDKTDAAALIEELGIKEAIVHFRDFKVPQRNGAYQQAVSIKSPHALITANKVIYGTDTVATFASRYMFKDVRIHDVSLLTEAYGCQNLLTVLRHWQKPFKELKANR